MPYHAHSSQQAPTLLICGFKLPYLADPQPNGLLPVAPSILTVSFAATPCDVPRFGTDCFVVRTSPGFRYQICWERVLTKEHKGFGGQSWPRDPHHQNDRCASSCLYLMSVMPQYVIVIIAMRIDELSSPETVMIASTECCQAYREYQPIHN